MASKPTTVAAYLKALSADRREAVEALREVVNANIDPRFEEGIQYGMLAWYLPHSEYPAGYHCDPKQPLPFASVASQKNHIGIYLFCIYTNADDKQRFVDEWKATGARLDMGKSCVRVKKLDDVPLAVLGRAIRRATAKKFVASYEGAVGASASPVTKRATKKRTSKKAASKKSASSKKVAAKKKIAKKKTASKKATSKKLAKRASSRARATR